MSTLYICTDTGFREATDDEVRSHPAVPALPSEDGNERNPHSLRTRSLLVTYHRELRIKGRWLERAGFAIGARVNVRVFRKRLIIDVAQEPREAPARRLQKSTRPAALT